MVTVKKLSSLSRDAMSHQKKVPALVLPLLIQSQVLLSFSCTSAFPETDAPNDWLVDFVMDELSTHSVAAAGCLSGGGDVFIRPILIQSFSRGIFELLNFKWVIILPVNGLTHPK